MIFIARSQEWAGRILGMAVMLVGSDCAEPNRAQRVPEHNQGTESLLQFDIGSRKDGKDGRIGMAGAVEALPKVIDRKSAVRIEVDSEKMSYQHALAVERL